MNAEKLVEVVLEAYKAGKSDGMHEGYELHRNALQQKEEAEEGYDSDYNVGYKDAKHELKKEFNKGYDEGYDSGYNVGYEDAKRESEKDFDNGFEKGFEEGLNERSPDDVELMMELQDFVHLLAEFVPQDEWHKFSEQFHKLVG